MKVLSVVNKKGGVGKTTVASNLAQGLSLLGKKVLVIDNDEQHNLTSSLGLQVPDVSLADCYNARPEELNATVANMRFVKPLDHALVKELAFGHDLLVTIEENAVIGGAGSEVARSLEEQGLNARLLRLGLPDRFTEHGDSGVMLAQLGLDADGIAEKVKRAILG